jgi:hypothetical protein
VGLNVGLRVLIGATGEELGAWESPPQESPVVKWKICCHQYHCLGYLWANTISIPTFPNRRLSWFGCDWDGFGRKSGAQSRVAISFPCVTW